MKEGAGAGGAARGGAGRHPRGGDGGMIRKNDIMPCMHACICGKRKERRERESIYQIGRHYSCGGKERTRTGNKASASF